MIRIFRRTIMHSTRFDRHAIAVLTLSLAVLLQPNASDATTIVGPLDAATGIDGLNVDGTEVNVTFLGNTSFSTAFPANNPFYDGNSSGAADAANAMGIEMSAAGVIALAGATCACETVYVPFGIPMPSVPTQAFGPVGPAVWGVLIGKPGGSVFIDTRPDLPGSNYWAVVTPASTGVPEPATFGLFSLGLVGMGLVWRRCAC